ncbi:potassium transporter TrkG [Roseibacterium sp. SDUM158017]|uniref:TrkH family potassium uptake protein n=1 Tax=Roseicyclus salinarum TaxID=3036773 RepID=UPI002414E79D|nr:potassium transporter TrkG [Roseibacterium sp. SDUM158017]MDG4647813.1 potassium transporter TrkG [Roseibacterium sp. SDUM158017]
MPGRAFSTHVRQVPQHAAVDIDGPPLVMRVKRAAAIREGSEAIAQPARLSVIALTLAKHAPIFTVLCLPPALWAALEREWPLAAALALPAVLAAAIYVATSARPLPQDLRGVEAMLGVTIVFGLSVLLLVPAFMTLGMPPADALFEAMSAATTTGLSVAADPGAWPVAGHVLRAWTQWCGGLVIATAVLALLLPSGLPARKLGQAGIDQGDRIASTRRQAQQLLGVYVGLTVVMGGLNAWALPGWREGVLLTLTAVSTGGFAPRADSIASYHPFAQGLVILTCTLGAVSLLTFVLVLQGKWRDAWHLGSLRRVLVAVALFSAAYAALLALNGVTAPDEIYRGLLNLVSGLTTTGFAAGPIPSPGPLLLLIVVAMAVGGDVGSTAGGLKLARIGLLADAFRDAIRRPRLPSRAVAPLRNDGETVDDRTLAGLLALLFVFLCVMLLVWMQLLAHGHPALPALFETVSALSTVGMSTGIVGPDMAVDLKLSLTFAMWLGRLEFVAVLLLFTPRTWINR